MEILRRRPQPPRREPEIPITGQAIPAELMNDSLPAPRGVQVIWGASMQTLELAGMRVEDARRLLQSLLHVDPEAPALINGEPARPAQRIQAGDTIEFVVHAGEKGHESRICSVG